MPAHWLHGSPAQQMARWLADARERGLTFEDAWAEAMAGPSVPGVGIWFPHETKNRIGWIVALIGTRREWRAAYLREDSDLSRALQRVATSEAVRDDWSAAAPRPGELVTSEPAMAAA